MASATASLESYNSHVEEVLAETGKKLEHYTKLNKSLQKDLGEIYQKLRNIKRALEAQYPQYTSVAEQAVAHNAAVKGRATDVDAEDAELDSVEK